MLFDANRKVATKGARSTCPLCGKECIAKCGDIVKHHWAHRVDEDCDPWAERGQDISTWHRDWQEQVPQELREVVIGPHRADIVTAGAYPKIVELQHSNLAPSEIRERELFYRYPQNAHGMWWVFDATSAYNNGRLDVYGKTIVQFCWKRPRLSILSCQRPVFLDIGIALLNVLRVDLDESRLVGIAQVFTRQAMLDRITGKASGDFDDTLSCNEKGSRVSNDADDTIEWSYVERD